MDISIYDKCVGFKRGGDKNDNGDVDDDDDDDDDDVEEGQGMCTGEILQADKWDRPGCN